MIKLIIFDWDDVFALGAKTGYFKCYHETLVDLDVHLDPEEEKRRILEKWSKPHREELRGLLKENPHLLDNACKIYEEKLFGNTFVDCLEPVEGSIELVKKLQKKYILCVATGVHPTILKDKVMPKFNFPQVFTETVSSYDIDDIEKQKPHPHMVEQMLAKQKIQANEAILVGDAKGDVLMARAAGVEPIVVLTGHLSREEAEELNVKHIIDDVTHLEKVLSVLNDS
ncbi:HAD family hydrolase [Nanoarchaeota archaeon]